MGNQAVDAFNRGDLGAVLALTDPDVEIASRLAVIEGGYHGHDGVRRWWQDLYGVFPDWNVEVVEMRERGDLTLATLRTSGHGVGSEVPVEQDLWQVTRWRDKKILRLAFYDTEAEAYAAADLSEQDAHADS